MMIEIMFHSVLSPSPVVPPPKKDVKRYQIKRSIKVKI